VKNGHIGAGVFVEDAEGVGQRLGGGAIDGVAYVWAIYRDDRDGAVVVDGYGWSGIGHGCSVRTVAAVHGASVFGRPASAAALAAASRSRE